MYGPRLQIPTISSLHVLLLVHILRQASSSGSLTEEVLSGATTKFLSRGRISRVVDHLRDIYSIADNIIYILGT